MEMIVMQPRDWSEIPQAILALRQQKTIVLDLAIYNSEQAQQVVDFIAGGTYALNGHSQLIGERSFLFTPSCVQVSV